MVELAHVAGGGHDDDAGTHRALNRQHQRIIQKAVRARTAQREVDDANVVAFAIANCPFDGANDVRDDARTVGAKHFQIDQACAWSHADVADNIVDRAAIAAAGHNARDVRAVPVLVGRIAIR